MVTTAAAKIEAVAMAVNLGSIEEVIKVFWPFRLFFVSV